MSASLYLLHTRPDDRLLVAWGSTRHLMPRRGDLGYALHGALHAAFGERAPQPFRFLGGDQGLLAYTRHSPDAVRDALAVGDPQAVAALGLGATAAHGGFSMRALPARWSPGRRLRFEVRVRPVLRDGKTGRERDAFLRAADTAPAGTLDRAEVYVRWLHDQLVPVEGAQRQPWHGAVRLEAVRMTEFHLAPVMRMGVRPDGDGRRPRVDTTGPDAVLSGTLAVEDAEAFGHWLARGVGRHRAFGFGMVLLRPAD